MNLKSTSIALISTFLSLPAFADNNFEAEANLTQDKGTQLNGVLRWILPANEKVVFRWGPTLSVGSTENTRINDAGQPEEQHFQFAGAGVSFIGKTSTPSVSAITDITLGVDGLGLKNIKNEDAKHLLYRASLNLRLESPTGSFYSAGFAFLNRSLPKDKSIFVNNARLTTYSLTPSVSFGYQF